MNNTFIIWTQGENDTNIAHLICGNCNHEMVRIKSQTNIINSLNTNNRYYCSKCGNIVLDKTIYPYTKYNPGSSSICKGND